MMTHINSACVKRKYGYPTGLNALKLIDSFCFCFTFKQPESRLIMVAVVLLLPTEGVNELMRGEKRTLVRTNAVSSTTVDHIKQN